MKKIFIGLSLLAISCSNNEQLGWRNDFTDSDFEHIDIDLSSGVPLTFLEDSILKPWKIVMLDNNILAVEEKGSDRMVWMVDMDKQKCHGHITRGSGPDELLDITTMNYSDGILTLAGLNDNKVMECRVLYDSLDLKPVNHTVLPYKGALRSISMDDEHIFSIAPAFSGDRYYIYNRIDSTYSSLKSFPLDSTYIGVTPDNAFFQADIAINRNRSHIAVANMSWNIIEIFDIASNKWTTLFGPTQSEAKVSLENMGMVKGYRQNPMWITWRNISMGENSIYIGYDGSCLNNRDDRESGHKSIYTFDYSGQPLKIYHFDHPFLYFTIDEVNGYIYLTQENPEPTIIRYNL